MTKLLAATLVAALGLLLTPAARAQSSAPDFPTAPAPAKSLTTARRTPADAAREQRRATMTPEEQKHDQQMAILEARTGNTSFGTSSGPERQLDGTGNGFMVRKFKAKPGTAKQERGMTHLAGGANPAGKPLVHNHNKKKFLFF